MQDDKDYVSLLRIPRRWFRHCSWLFIFIVCVSSLAFLIGPVRSFFNTHTWIQHISVVMTIITGYTFIVTRSIDLVKDPERRYAEGRAEKNKIIKDKRDQFRQDPRTSIPKDEVVQGYNEILK